MFKKLIQLYLVYYMCPVLPITFMNLFWYWIGGGGNWEILYFIFSVFEIIITTTTICYWCFLNTMMIRWELSFFIFLENSSWHKMIAHIKGEKRKGKKSLIGAGEFDRFFRSCELQLLKIWVFAIHFIIRLFEVTG